MFRAGIDEAGRGPVLGPLVVGLVVIDASRAEEFERAGITDSKALSPKKRELLAELIRERSIRAEVVIADPARIDRALASPTSNLNLLEADLTAELLHRLPGGSGIVAIDLPTRNEAAYRAELMARCPLSSEVSLVLEHKADVNHVACAAASIIAKVERDRLVRLIETEMGTPVGSGYPSDPKTRAFLESHGVSHKHLFRTSWASYTTRFGSSGQQTLI